MAFRASDGDAPGPKAEPHTSARLRLPRGFPKTGVAMRYLPHTEAEIQEMLAVIGAKSIDELFQPIPESARLGRELELPRGMDEAALMAHMERLAGQNTASQKISFLGAGIYDHHVPPAVDQLLLRGEFYTAYTPYQAEVAQGTLQAIFEFQTIVSELFGLPVANASMYDAASGAAEAALMARRLTRRNRVLLSPSLHPDILETVRTYFGGLGDVDTLVQTLDVRADSTLDPAALAAAIDDTVACVITGYPNFYGVAEDLRSLASVCHDKGALLVSATLEPYALGVLESPGALGADIAVGEGQAIGVPPQFGGPGCGLFACRDERAYLQNVPGRLCGETVDQAGKRGYVLTLSTREQHIRRERATSNICTNHSLCALAVAIRVSLLGKRGFREIAEQCLSRAEYVKAKLLGSGAWELAYDAPTFNEFVVRHRTSPVAPIVAALGDKGILAGVELSRFDTSRDRDLLICVTERHDKSALDALVSGLTSNAS